jgi:hypothetical protein
MRKSLITSLYSEDVRTILDCAFSKDDSRFDPDRQVDIAKRLVSWKIDPQFSYAGRNAVDAALAQIVLRHIELHLPDFTLMEHERLIHARPAYRTPTLSKDMLVKPIRLFMIDWCLSGSGQSWPEAYHATWLPGYDVFVVTLSQDTDEALGLTDLAIGWFRDDNIFDKSCGRIVTRYWRTIATEHGQPMWETFVSAGRFDEATARKWARRVHWNVY